MCLEHFERIVVASGLRLGDCKHGNPRAHPKRKVATVPGHPVEVTVTPTKTGITLSYRETQRIQFGIVKRTLSALKKAHLVPDNTTVKPVEVPADPETKTKKHTLIVISMEPVDPIRPDRRTREYRDWIDSMTTVVWTMNTSIQALHTPKRVVERIGKLS